MALAPAYGFNPTTGDGYAPSDVSALLDRISKLDPSKIFFFEISDVQLPDPPLYKGSPYDDWAKAQPEGTPARSNWVLTARSIPYIGRKLGKDVKSEKDMGAAHVAQVAKAVFATGFRGESLMLEDEMMGTHIRSGHLGGVRGDRDGKGGQNNPKTICRGVRAI